MQHEDFTLNICENVPRIKLNMNSLALPKLYDYIFKCKELKHTCKKKALFLFKARAFQGLSLCPEAIKI